MSVAAPSQLVGEPVGLAPKCTDDPTGDRVVVDADTAVRLGSLTQLAQGVGK
jgi:hypothetical protein